MIALEAAANTPAVSINAPPPSARKVGSGRRVSRRQERVAIPADTCAATTSPSATAKTRNPIGVYIART
jgi:hypothetical protein